MNALIAGVVLLFAILACQDAGISAPQEKKAEKTKESAKMASDNPEKADRQKTGRPDWRTFRKPGDADLRKMLTPLEYQVTQKEGTEPPFQNAYDKNKREGIYVDVVSGEPLFSSRDKYDSKTGWPSFTKPLEPGNITTREDRSLFSVRTEVRSRHGNSHLGHVFDDGPPPTGLRYCMNSASLRFIPKEDLEREGYGEYVNLFVK